MNAFLLRRSLRATALLLVLGTLALWAATGAHRGWTRTTVVEQRVDEVTGIEYPVTRPGFVAGIEVLGLGLAAGIALAGLTLLPAFRRPVAA